MASIYNIDERIEDAVKTAIMIANDDSHGYDQEMREGPNDVYYFDDEGLQKERGAK